MHSRRESQFRVISDTPDKNYSAILVLPLRTENWSHKSACWTSRFPSGAEARVFSGFLRRGWKAAPFQNHLWDTFWAL